MRTVSAFEDSEIHHDRSQVLPAAVPILHTHHSWSYSRWMWCIGLWLGQSQWWNRSVCWARPSHTEQRQHRYSLGWFEYYSFQQAHKALDVRRYPEMPVAPFHQAPFHRKKALNPHHISLRSAKTGRAHFVQSISYRKNTCCWMHASLCCQTGRSTREGRRANLVIGCHLFCRTREFSTVLWPICRCLSSKPQSTELWHR